MPNAVIYARYSSHAQRDTSIDQQIAVCRAFAQRGGIEVVDVYTDRALTGTNDKRPGFRKMIADSSKHQWEYVIVYSLDRFSRDRYDAATNKHALRENGVKVISATEPITDDPVGVLMESVLEGFAEYYSRELSAKVRRGMDDNARKCKSNGSIPMGYRKGEDGTLEVAPEEAAIVLEIFQRVASGDTLTRISEDLNARGVPTKRGGKWRTASYNILLHNERYLGTYIYKDIRIPGGMPAIIQPDLFYAVQAVMGGKKNPRCFAGEKAPVSRRRADGVYLLTGKLFCGDCGSPMVGVSGTSSTNALHHYYSCNGRRTKKVPSCGMRNIRRDDIERDIATAIKNTMLTPETIEAIAEASYQYQMETFAAPDLNVLEQQLADTTRSINNIMAAIEQGVFTASTRDRLQELETQKETLTSRISIARKSAENLPTKAEIAEMLRFFAAGDLDDALYQEALIDMFLVRAYVHSDHYDIYFSTDAKTCQQFPLGFADAVAPIDDMQNRSYKVDIRPPNQSSALSYRTVPMIDIMREGSVCRIIRLCIIIWQGAWQPRWMRWKLPPTRWLISPKS